MPKAVKKTFKWVARATIGLVADLAKPILRALTPKAPEVDTSSSVNFRADPNAGVPYVIGQTGTAGIYTYATVGEAKNRNLLFYTILSGGGPIDSYVSFKMGDVSVVFDGPDTPTSGPYASHVWMRRQLGTVGAAALLPPNTLDAGVLAEWSSAHKTTGYAAAWYVLGADQNTYANGVPDPMWEIKGVRVYDWRDDDTYPGGSGPQRLADPTTWLFNENPAVHAVAWCLGRYQNGKRVLGLGATLSQIAMAKATEWANVCDANGWKVGGVVYSTDTKWQVLKAICQAGGGYPTPLGTQISFIFNAPRVSIATLTGADIEADPSIVGAQLRRDRFNRGVARYREKNNNWQIVPSAPLTVAEFVTQDGDITRTKEFEWPLVQNVDQAAQLLAYAMCNSRELGPLEFAVTPPWSGLDPGDCITINEPEFGLTNQKVVVTARSRSLSDFGRSLTCVTETDSKHAFCLGQSGTPPPLPSLSAVDTLPTPPEATDWEITAGEVTGPGGTLPAIILTGAVTDPNAVEVIFEYREVISPGVYGPWMTVTRPITGTEYAITEGIKAGAKYQVRVRYRYARNTEDPTGGNTDLGEVIVSPISAPVPPDVLADIAAAQSAADAAQLDADTALTALFDPTSGALVEIDTLQSGQANHTSQIAALQTADITLAGSIDTTEARMVGLPNLLLNSDGSDPTPMRYWSATAGRFNVAYDANIGPFVYATPGPSIAYYYQDVAAIPGSIVSASLYGNSVGMTGANRGQFYVQFLNSSLELIPGYGSSAFMDLTTVGWGMPLRLENLTVPAGAAYTRVLIVQAAGAPSGVSFSRIMFNYGAKAVAWNDARTAGNTVSRVQTTEITSSSNTAAIAATDTRVGVSMQQGAYINANARMGSYTTTPGLPDGWPTLYGTGPASRFSRQVGEGANYSVRAALVAAEELGFHQSITLTAGKYLLTLEGKCNSGNWSGAALTVGGASINCLTDQDLAGVTGAGGTGVRRWSKIITIPAGTYNFHAMYGWTGAGTITAKNLDLYVAGIEPLGADGQVALNASADAASALIAAATANSAIAAYEVEANARLNGLDASVSTQGTAISNLQGRTASWLTKVAAAGADPAYIYMQSDATAAGGADSYIALVAKSLFLFNTVGGVLVPAMSLTGGNAFFPGTVWVGPTNNLEADGPNKRWLVRDGSSNIVCEMGQLL